MSDANPDAGIVQNVRLDKTDFTIDPFVRGQIPTDYNPFQAEGPARPAGPVSEAFTIRPFDQWAAYDMNGLHGVIGFAIPADQLGTQGDGYGSPVMAFRAVSRPVPQNWDAPWRVGGSSLPPGAE